MALTLMYITNDPEVARIAEKNGVDRIWIDLETLGKEERQKGMNTVKSRHTVEDVKRISGVLTDAAVLVRVNPWNENSCRQINAVIDAGADYVMLPMWKTAEEVRSFVRAVDGRAKTMLLLETKEAEACLDAVLMIPGIDEIHIGLNDLHLSYGLKFMFQLLCNGTVERICAKLKKAGMPYGFGGIARIGAGALPAERILGEHVRLESKMVILSRAFCDTSVMTDSQQIDTLFAKELCRLRAEEERLHGCSQQELLENKEKLIACVDQIVKAKE